MKKLLYLAILVALALLLNGRVLAIDKESAAKANDHSATAAGIEKNEKVICQVISKSISSTMSVMVIRVKDGSGMNLDGLKRITSSYSDISSEGIRTVTFAYDHNKPIKLTELLSSATGEKSGKRYAKGHGGVLKIDGCHGRDCETPCRDASCEQVLGECESHFDHPCDWDTNCYGCE